MVTARIKIEKTGNTTVDKYIILYVVDGFESTPIIIDGKLHHDKMFDVRKLIKLKGGANHIKREILINNVMFHKGAYLL